MLTSNPERWKSLGFVVRPAVASTGKKMVGMINKGDTGWDALLWTTDAHSGERATNSLPILRVASPLLG